MAKITGFKIENHNWLNSDVELYENSKHGKVTHQYWSVPKELVMKLLNAKSQPDVGDFDKWMREKDGVAKMDTICCSESCFWDKEKK